MQHWKERFVAILAGVESISVKAGYRVWGMGRKSCTGKPLYDWARPEVRRRKALAERFP